MTAFEYLKKHSKSDGNTDIEKAMREYAEEKCTTQRINCQQSFSEAKTVLSELRELEISNAILNAREPTFD